MVLDILEIVGKHVIVYVGARYRPVTEELVTECVACGSNILPVWSGTWRGYSLYGKKKIKNRNGVTNEIFK